MFSCAELAKLSASDPGVQTLQQEAEQAFRASDFAAARMKLNAAAEVDRKAMEALNVRAKERALGAAANFERSAQIAILDFEYRKAANSLSVAIELVTPYDRHEAWRLTLVRAGALFQLGEYGQSDDLREAISVYGDALRLAPRGSAVRDWAMTQQALGTALRTLGERQEQTTTPEESETAFRRALEVQTRTLSPEDWAMSRSGLAGSLVRLGAREGGTLRLEQALAAKRCSAPTLSSR